MMENKMNRILTIAGNQDVDVEEITKDLVLPKNESLKEIITMCLVISHKYRKGVPTIAGETDKNCLTDDLARLAYLRDRFAAVSAHFEGILHKAEGRFKNQLEGEFYLEARKELEKEYEEKYEKYKRGDIDKPRQPTDTYVKASAEMKSKDNRKRLAEAQANVKYIRAFWSSAMESANTLKAVLKYTETQGLKYD